MRLFWTACAAAALCFLLPAARPARASLGQASDARTSALFNTHVKATGGPWAGGDWVAFLVPEEEKDLNGDRDTDDSVLHVVDIRTQQVTNLGLAVDPLLTAPGGAPPVAISGNTLAVLVSEHDQGNKDLNGDGDAKDNVLEWVDLTSRRVTNTHLAGSEVHIDGNRIAVLTPERDQGNKDLNGDGDTDDEVLQIYDTATQQVWNSGLAATEIRLAGDWAEADTPEAAQGNKDLNGDGDRADIVPQLVNLNTHEIVNTRLARGGFAALTPRLFAVGVDEAAQGKQDLNGNGDTDDQVLHVVDLATKETINTRWDASDGIAASGALVAFVTNEQRQREDLNGDGDRFDSVAQLFELETRKVTNLKQDASGGIAVSAGHVAIVTDEEAQGNRDLNGDGDADDQVLQLYDLKRRALVNLRQAVSGEIVMNDTLLVYRVSEANQGNQDLNGDGDTSDKIATAYLLSSQQPIVLRQASTDSLAASERAVAFLSPPAHATGRRVAEDAPDDDNVCVVYRVR